MSIPALLTRACTNGVQRGMLSSCARSTCVVTPQQTLLPTTPVQSTPARFVGSRSNCAPNAAPSCSPQNLAKSPCMEKKKDKNNEKPSTFTSMWLNPECCHDPCPDVLPRFDELYYKISDKAKRSYQQTWVECPELKLVKKRICCFDKLKMPSIKKRPRKDRPKTACKEEETCQNKTNKKCPKFRLPKCRGVRDPPKCKTERGPSNCKKVCAPYPAFSECRKPKPNPLRPSECACLKANSLCEAFAYLRVLKTRGQA